MKFIDQPISALVVVCWKFDTFNKVFDFLLIGAPGNVARAPKVFILKGLSKNFLRQQH